MTDHFISFSGVEIYYRKTGTGRPVMLVHGFGEDGEVWKEQVAFLKDRFKLLIPDLPGSGRSGLLPGADIDQYAGVLKAIADAEGINSLALLGHSMGGYITLAFAEKYPDLLSCFGLLHSTAYADNTEKKAARKKAIGFMEQYGAYEFLKTSTPALFASAFSHKNPERIEALIASGKQFTIEAVVQYYRAMINRPDRTNVLLNFTKPVLFIFGEKDNAIPFPQSLEQSYLPQVSYIRVLRGSGHMGMWEEPDRFNDILNTFLGDLEV